LAVAVAVADEEASVPPDVAAAEENNPETVAAVVSLVAEVVETPDSLAVEPEAAAEPDAEVLAVEAVVVALLAGPVLLFTRGNKGVKL